MQKKDPPFFSKMAFVMKLSILTISILCCTAAGLKASYTNAQPVLEKRVTLHAKGVTIKECLDKIARAADISFVYTGNPMLTNNKVNIDVKNKKIGPVLNVLLDPLPLSYLVVDDHI